MTRSTAPVREAQKGYYETYPGRIAVFSAGSHPTAIYRDAIDTSNRFEIEIRTQAIYHLSEIEALSFDYMITVCYKARETCPAFPGGAHQVN